MKSKVVLEIKKDASYEVIIWQLTDFIDFT